MTDLRPAGNASLSYLDQLVSYEQSGYVELPTIQRTAALVAALGHPERRLAVIHVTGTNGKGSTTAVTAALLAASGYRVGTYTSPHLVNVAERIAVDGRPVDEAHLWAALDDVARAAERTEITPSWFEALTAAGLLVLAEQQVDIAVVEVGMLGRWDATNVVDGTVAVVTNVALDHTDVAGPTRAAIAREKAGIIKRNSTLVLGETDPELRPIFEGERPRHLVTLGRELNWDNRSVTPSGSVVDLTTPWGTRTGVQVGMVGPHQCDNALLALGAAEAFLRRPLPDTAVRRALADTQVPARFEMVGVHPTVIYDGAHNPAGAAALRAALDERLDPTARSVLVYGALAGRSPEQFLEQIDVNRFDVVLATTPDSPRAIPADVVAGAARHRGARRVVVAARADVVGLAVAEAGSAGTVTVTGSLHLVGPLRARAG